MVRANGYQFPRYEHRLTPQTTPIRQSAHFREPPIAEGTAPTDIGATRFWLDEFCSAVERPMGADLRFNKIIAAWARLNPNGNPERV